jgi:hypothetical protein
MIKNILLAAAVALFICACASSRAAVNPYYNFESVKSVRVGNFGGGQAGSAVQGAFIRQLMARGYGIKTEGDADAIVDGSITGFSPNRSFLVQNNNVPLGSNNVVVMNSNVTEISGSAMYDLGTAFGVPDSRVVASNAVVGVNAFMKDGKTGEIVWTDSVTQESLDLQGAVTGAVRYVLKSLPSNNPVRKN